MTCAFCKYEFCWACGASATTADRHFDIGRGCGVEMMDESVKPGDHLHQKKKCFCFGRLGWRIVKAILLFLFAIPFFLIKM